MGKIFLSVVLASFLLIKPAFGESIVVGGAADLAFAFKEIGEIYEKKTGSKVEFAFGSSGTLAKQIENGAPLDVFASADVSYVDKLISRGKIIAGTKYVYAKGRIIIASLKKNGIAIKSLSDLKAPGIKRIAIANPAHAPYGIAAKEALMKGGILGDVEKKLIYGENIRQTLQFLETGNVDVAIISLSLLKKETLNYLLIDENQHNPIIQGMGIVSSTKNKEDAQKFIDILKSLEGKAIMEKYGFVTGGLQ